MRIPASPLLAPVSVSLVSSVAATGTSVVQSPAPWTHRYLLHHYYYYFERRFWLFQHLYCLKCKIKIQLLQDCSSPGDPELEAVDRALSPDTSEDTDSVHSGASGGGSRGQYIKGTFTKFHSAHKDHGGGPNFHDWWAIWLAKFLNVRVVSEQLNFVKVRLQL